MREQQQQPQSNGPPLVTQIPLLWRRPWRVRFTSTALAKTTKIITVTAAATSTRS